MFFHLFPFSSSFLLTFVQKRNKIVEKVYVVQETVMEQPFAGQNTQHTVVNIDHVLMNRT